MARSRTEVEAVVKQVLNESLGGNRIISLSDKPISGLGLDSLEGIDFACEIQQRLGCCVPNKVNPFLNEASGKVIERSVIQIVDFVAALCGCPMGVAL